MPKQVKARAAQDEKEERMVRELARNPHAPAESVNYARMVVESWAGKSPKEIAAELTCPPQTVRTRLEIFNANKGIKGLGTSELEGLLDNLAKKQDNETKQKEYKAYKFSPDLPTLASLERVLGSVLNPVLFKNPDRNEATQGLKQAYQLMLKDNTTPANLRGAIGLVCFTLELLDAAEKQNQDLDSPNELLEDPPVRDWFKEVYAPPDASENSPTKKQEEENLNDWERLDFEKLKVYRVGTTSFILKCQTKEEIHKLVEKELVLKCLLYPYTLIDVITKATRRYALQYSVDKEPETIHVVPHVYASTDKWILMDFIPGDTLREFLQKQKKAEKTDRPLLLRTDLLISIGTPLLKALETLSLFDPPLQHEDLTPSNIIVRTKQDGRTIDGITFIDLGRNYLYTGHLGLETRQDARFVAPEVKSGGSSDRADLYSFGMLLIELSDPIGVQGDTIPDSLYQYAPYLARFIEDLIDKKPENRLLIFPLASGKDCYPQLCSTLEKLLKVLPSEHELKLGKFFWVQQFIALFFPKDQLAQAWKLWRIMHPDFQRRKFWRVLRPFPTQPAIAEFTGRLYGWLIVSTVGWWLIFFVCIVWGARDFKMNPFAPFYISIPQTLLPGCKGLCWPGIDALQAPGYAFVITNMQARLVGFSSGLTHSVYYANILAGLTTRPMRRSTLARVTELFLRAFSITYIPLVLIGNLYQPAWWPVMLLIGLTIPALTNILCYQLATSTFKEARGEFSTVPFYDPSLKNFGQWGTTLSCYIIVVFFIWLGMQNNLLHDVWAYAIGAVVINVFIFCLSKGIILASGVRGSLCRAFTLGERLEAVAQNLVTKYQLRTNSRGKAVRAIGALHQGKFKGAKTGGGAVTANQVYGYEEIDKLLTLVQHLAAHDSTNKDSKLSDANVSSYLADALVTYLRTTIPNCHPGNKPTGNPTPHN